MLANLPTPEQIAAMVCRQPIGAVLAYICRDLGIPASHPLWRELHLAINQYGGNWLRLAMEEARSRLPDRNIVARLKPNLPPRPKPAGTAASRLNRRADAERP